MQIVKRRIVVGTGADRRPPDRNRQVEGVRPAANIVHLLPLNMHAADEDSLRPLEILGGCGPDIFVDEPDRPVFGQIGRDQQQPLRGHEGLNAVGQRIGVFERAKGGRVARKDAQDTARNASAFSSHSSLCAFDFNKLIMQPPSWATNFSGLWQWHNPARPAWLLSPGQMAGLQSPQAIRRLAKSGNSSPLVAR